MNVQVKLTDGSFSEVPNVKWHPEFERHVSQTDTVTEPGGLWITEDALFAHLKRVNDFREKNGIEPRELKSPRDCHELVEFASAPFCIYVATEDGTPWRDNGTLVRTVPYGGDDSFWNRR